ncbi:hypothetical protein PGT21_013567 [Puccinia graminis f. sp. tritici]|uniref:Uncharacterized protein n=2 Tax=Puccinia graminis f. sp. tritici TaxID=56615 RepID=H6QPV3_PUCGT|nr:uncharacterized protein PGTG_20905 [Puccinia graminis f. sp. tritici CRL 75-36-700-3]EHS64291.1 hypothetical protein PGTG_20905 [Puccinia graminis f. sp. tritici CRL 75-36-700-3]KAA1114554.1 hypothetical protein PGT21_013567 [Puccinia graminis f. sp. tritici]
MLRVGIRALGTPPVFELWIPGAKSGGARIEYRKVCMPDSMGPGSLSVKRSLELRGDSAPRMG